jgi:amino acid adenylation domain-containing protein
MTEEQSFNPFAGGELLRVAPTTPPQQEILAAAKMSDEANTAFNEAIALHIDGPLDRDLLERCFNTLIERHEILRTTFSPAGDEMCLHEPGNVSFEYEDLRNHEEQQKQHIVQNLLKNIAISPMNLEEGPLFFVWLKEMEESVYELIIATHHLVCDGWSFGILLEELVKLYNSGADTTLLAAPSSFYDYAEEQSATSVKNIDTDFWLDSLKKLPPTLDLPLDNNRPATRSFTAARLDYKLSKEIVHRLPKAASALKSSIVNYVLAAYFSLLYRLTGNEDIVVGLPLAGQVAFNQLNLFGHLVQLIPIRLQFNEKTTFAELVGMVKNEVIKASEHPNFTFGELLKNFTVDRSRVPIISTIFNIDQPSPPLQLGNASATVRSIPRAAESFEIFLNILPSSDELLIEATYSQSLFSGDTISAWLTALEEILRNGLQNHHITLDALQLASNPPAIIENLNQTERESIYNDVVSALRAQVQKNPTAVAVISNNTPLTYAELDRSSSQLAQHLYNNGIGEGSIVGICCQRSDNLLRSTLAVLKLGAAYLPLDPEFPEERLVYMLEDSRAVAVIEDDQAPEGVKNAEAFHINPENLHGTDSLSIDLPDLIPNSNRLAYTIYTSGSTGKPKGVDIPNSAMINFLESMAETPGLTSKDRLLAVTTLSFDISVLELFLPLLVGGTVIIADSEDCRNGEKLASLIEQHQITVIQATPSTWRMLLASRWEKSPSMTQAPFKALCGGEPLPQSLISELLPNVSELWNMYGPTETTVWSTCKKIDSSDPFIAIGRPIANTQIYILDSNLHPSPLSVPGELCIGGKGVALGYRNRPELTADRFVEHPDFGRIYRTGDLAKVHPSGEIQHLGRMDDQVKLRGYRIELGEIETALASCDGIKQAAVYLWSLSDEDIRIVACCVPKEGSPFEAIKIRKQLRSTLPNYMVPQYFLNIDALPLTPNGKIDRRSLPRPEIGEQSILSKRKLTNDTEKRIAGIWSDLLKISGAIGRDDNFFEIGGHSLLALEAVRRIEIATGVRLEIRQIITEGLSALAERITAPENTKTDTQNNPKALKQSAIRRLSQEQLRLLAFQLSHPDDTSNNLPAAWLLDGELDIEVFKTSMKRLYERQTALRTVITKGDEGYQLALRHISETNTLIFKDFSENESPLDDAVKDVTEIAGKSLSVIDTQLCHVWLYTLAPTRHVLALLPHQLIFDGWSFDIFLKELEILYTNTLQGNAAALDLLPIQFRDFADWSASRQPDKDILQYHNEAFQRSFEGSYPFKVDAPKGKCLRQVVKLSQDNLKAIESFCEKHKLRLHEVIFSALAKYYGKYLKQDILTISLPVTGRYIPEAIGLIGCFVSKLPAEIHIQSGSFLDTAGNIAEQVRIFYKNQDLNLGQLLQGAAYEKQTLPAGLSLSFAYQDIRNRPDSLANLQLSQITIDREQTELPVEFWSRVEKDGLLLAIDYDDSQAESTIVAYLLENIAKFLTETDRIERNGKTGTSDEPSIHVKKTFWRRLFN